MNRFFFINKIFIFLILISSAVYGEQVIGVGEKIHDEYTSKKKACDIALERAKQDAVRKSVGIESSVEIVNKCSEIDGELECERNQLSILRSNGEITKLTIIDEDYDKYNETEFFYCKITIEAEVIAIKKNNDPTFHFETELNKCLKTNDKIECASNQGVFRSGEMMRIDINTSRKMYMYIFQWLPYAKTPQVTKIFPNKNIQEITDNLISGKQSLYYEVSFPENIFEKQKDEWLIFVGSEKPIPWVEEYDKIERLYKLLIKPNLLVERDEISYIVIK